MEKEKITIKELAVGLLFMSAEGGYWLTTLALSFREEEGKDVGNPALRPERVRWMSWRPEKRKLGQGVGSVG